jgi:hypothetical protein
VAAPSRIGSGRVAGGVAVGTELGRPTELEFGLRLLPPPPTRSQAEASRAKVRVTRIAAAALDGVLPAGKTRILLTMVALQSFITK